MIRLVVRGLCAILLQLASAAIITALVSLALSAYLTARIVGVDPMFSKRTTAMVKFLNNMAAHGINMKREHASGIENGEG